MTEIIRSAPPAPRIVLRPHPSSLTGMCFAAGIPMVPIRADARFARAGRLCTVDGFGHLGVNFFFVLHRIRVDPVLRTIAEATAPVVTAAKSRPPRAVPPTVFKEGH